MNPEAEWLEADGLGGFASGTVSGIRTRRYHALLLAAQSPPAARFVLVNGFDAEIQTPAGRSALSSQRYAPGVTSPDGAGRIERFVREPWPRWTYRLGDGSRVEQEIFVPHGVSAVVISWRAASGTLVVRPFLSGRDYHALHHENPAFRFQPDSEEGRLVFRPYPGVPPIVAHSNGLYTHAPQWYRSFLYSQERERGLDCQEDLAAPGSFRWDLSKGEAWMVFSTRKVETDYLRLRDDEGRRRRAFASPLHRSADAYLIRCPRGRTIVAGYPWFTDWGRDAFISLRGLCLSIGRRDDAREILLSWAEAVSEGMIPNRFPDQGEQAEYNSVDASLWFIVAVRDFLRGAQGSAGDVATLTTAVRAILEGYGRGTRHGIRVDGDGLLRAGEPGVQLTWMDAKVGDQVVTPRIGKPVEVQALWLRALQGQGPAWGGVYERGLASFRSRFWNEAQGGLYDVVDADHVPGRADASFRPNQILAASLLDPARARRLVDSVEARLLTPAGLRTLAPGEPGYQGSYQGGIRERDAAYHQGTVWPWLMGAFVEAWMAVRGNSTLVKSEARDRFVQPLRALTEEAGLGHLFEIADGDPPHRPRGCPFQAWSLGELLRAEELTS